MKTKIIKSLQYTGLGFTIELTNVVLVEINGEWHPKIDVEKVADAAITALASQKERLTGNQVRFIRSYFSMTLRQFAKEVVHESHTAVSKWEKFADKPTNMDINIEFMLRLYIHEQINTKTQKQRNNFFNTYQELKELFALNNPPNQLVLGSIA